MPQDHFLQNCTVKGVLRAVKIVLTTHAFERRKESEGRKEGRSEEGSKEERKVEERSPWGILQEGIYDISFIIPARALTGQKPA